MVITEDVGAIADVPAAPTMLHRSREKKEGELSLVITARGRHHRRKKGRGEKRTEKYLLTLKLPRTERRKETKFFCNRPSYLRQYEVF